LSKAENVGESSSSPKTVLEALLVGSRPQKVRNLNLIDRICAAQAQGPKDFSVGTIGRLCEAVGGLKAKAFYNAASSDYRVLIE